VSDGFELVRVTGDARLHFIVRKTLAARVEFAMMLLAPPCVDEDGNEYTGEPLIDAEGFRRIMEGV